MTYDPTTLPQTYRDALQRMEREAPEYPQDLVEELGGCGRSPVTMWKRKPYFTGWKGVIPGLSDQMGIYAENADLEDIQFFAQWIYLIDKSRGLYVSIPGFTGGKFLMTGNVFDIGTERVRIGDPPEKLNALIRAGFERLQELMKEHRDGIQ